MAGDWIKMRVDLGDDPAVIQIACQLDIAEDEVVGKLHRLWSWADKHTTDGTAPAITGKWVDRYVGKTGFAEAMTAAHWISFSDAGVLFPEFDRHNGDSAKRRVEATLRQRLSRKNRDEGVTGEDRTTIPRPFVRHVMLRDAYKCVFCGTESSEEKESSRKAIMSVDHLKPITRGGSAAVENLACSCRACNSEKNDRTPEEWGLLPTFLQDGVFYKEGLIVTTKSQKSCDTNATREEKRREEETTSNPDGLVVAGVADIAPAKQDCPHQQIIALYHEVLPQCPQIRDWTPARAVQLRARWNEDARRQNIDYWRKFFEYVAQCDFLVGKANAGGKRPFFADLEWIVKSANFTKIREGKYAND